jgi:hypothetical protein
LVFYCHIKGVFYEQLLIRILIFISLCIVSNNILADFYAKGPIYGRVYHFGIYQNDNIPIFAFKGEDNVLRSIGRVFPNKVINEVTGNKYCHINTKTWSTNGESNYEIFAWAVNKATKKIDYYTKDSIGQYTEVDVDELYFECVKSPY